MIEGSENPQPPAQDRASRAGPHPPDDPARLAHDVIGALWSGSSMPAICVRGENMVPQLRGRP